MNLRNLIRPEYVYRPMSIVRRLCRRHRGNEIIQVKLRIGRLKLKMKVHRNEYLGQNLQTFGLYDLTLTETLVRLISDGATVVDVGANIGYTSVLCASLVGVGGALHAFEPIPHLHERLSANIALNGLSSDRLRTYPIAASHSAGYLEVELPAGFECNEGLLSLEPHTGGGPRLTVCTCRLDDALPANVIVDVMKIDVEGHEPSVLRGAERLLSEHRVHVVVYEEHRPHPNETAAIFEQHGYTVRRLEPGLTGLRVRRQTESVRKSLEPNWIAIAPAHTDRVLRRLDTRGWSVL